MDVTVKAGDIVIAPFRYAESEERKPRPCLVLGADAVSVWLVCITSQKLDKAFPTEVVLSDEDASAIGLHCRSKLDFMKRDKIPPFEVRKIIGHISALSKRKRAECYEAAQAAGLLSP